jgi:hypothetical protein
MNKTPYKLGTPIVIRPLELKRITLGRYGPSDPPKFSVRYRHVYPVDSISLHIDQINVGKSQYLLVYMFQSFASRTTEIVIARAR